MKDLQGFVDLALDTSDTTEETITLLTDLRTVGSAVGQLLFNLPDSCGLNELVAACSVLWDGSFDHRLLVYNELLYTCTMHVLCVYVTAQFSI